MSKRRFLLIVIPGLSVLSIAAAAQEMHSPSALLLPIVIIVVLVLFNALFVAAEFAIIGVRPTQMEERAGQNRAARAVMSVLESRPALDQYIATAQLGVTLASLGLAMYGEPAISHFIEPYLEEWFDVTPAAANRIGYIVALSLLTFLHVVVGEMVPKALALLDASNVAMALAQPMRIIGTVLHYPVVLLNKIGNGLLRLFRVPPAEGHDRLLAPEELELIVAESAEGGLIEDDEEEIIRNIFDFSERTVGQVMAPRRKIQAIPLNVGLNELLKTVTESNHSRFPVYDGDLDHIVGVLHMKDLVRHTVRSSGPLDLRLILRAAVEVPEDFRVDALLAAFKNQRLHMAIVRDEFGGVVGVVTLEDLVEEVVGEVRDEFDQEHEPYQELSPGVLEVSGDYLLDYLAEDVFLGEEDDLPDVETVAGLIISLLGRPPRVNDEVIVQENVCFTVLAVEGLAIVRVRVEFPTPASPQSPNAPTPGNG